MKLNPEHLRQLIDAVDDAFYIMDVDEAAKATVDVTDTEVTIDFSGQFEIQISMPDGEDDILVESPTEDLIVPLEQVRYAVKTLAHDNWMAVAGS